MPAAPPAREEPAKPMSSEQRNEIRALFAALGVANAREQFDLVEVLTGVRLRSVVDLDAKNAGMLIPRLRKRVESRSATTTGNAWNDREEDTWIDNL